MEFINKKQNKLAQSNYQPTNNVFNRKHYKKTHKFINFANYLQLVDKNAIILYFRKIMC